MKKSSTACVSARGRFEVFLSSAGPEERSIRHAAETQDFMSLVALHLDGPDPWIEKPSFGRSHIVTSSLGASPVGEDRQAINEMASRSMDRDLTSPIRV